jgi:serine O-acetyltransferase
MAIDSQLRSELSQITEALVATYIECAPIHHLGQDPLPSRDAVASILADLLDLFFPGYGRRQNLHLGNIEYYVGNLLDSVNERLAVQIARALRHELCGEAPHLDYEALGREKALQLLQRLPALCKILDEDVRAAFAGDPAARSHHEIIFCYPGLEAVATYRVAHELHKLAVPFIPRIMTELAHSKTGIDIHPGARIGRSFFIDHGTGVVIGETCELGDRVKIYQGVTLGALSFRHDQDGKIIRGTKRHPTLRDDVVVYANATILGGDTVIGERAVIGSNVWLTHSVEPDTVVTMEKPSLRIRNAKHSNSPSDMYHI